MKDDDVLAALDAALAEMREVAGYGRPRRGWTYDAEPLSPLDSLRTTDLIAERGADGVYRCRPLTWGDGTGRL